MQHPQPHIPTIPRGSRIVPVEWLGHSPKEPILRTARALRARGYILVIIQGGGFAAQRLH